MAHAATMARLRLFDEWERGIVYITEALGMKVPNRLSLCNAKDPLVTSHFALTQAASGLSYKPPLKEPCVVFPATRP